MVLALIASGCTESKTPQRGLRVPLPDGWVANAGLAGVLMVGPKGRVIVTLERRSAQLPSLEVLTVAVEAEGGSIVRAASALDSLSVRFAKPPSSMGLLVVRTLENGALLLCGSTPHAAVADLDPAEALCAGVRLEPAPRNKREIPAGD